MSAIDVTQRKLKFPPRFLPYLEKHRIFELFHECIELLVAIKPKDHLKFLRNMIPCAAKKRDKPRIVFIAPPSLEREKFATLLADCLEIECVTKSGLKLLMREKRYESLVKKIKVGKEEAVEEESCICMEEEPFQQIYFPGETFGDIYLGMGEHEVQQEEEEEGKEEEDLDLQVKIQQVVLPKPDSSTHILEGEVESKEKPCICVCPCVEEAQKREEKKRLEEEASRLRGEKTDDKDGKGRFASALRETSEEFDVEEKGEEEEEEWQGEEFDLPCEPVKKKKRVKKRDTEKLASVSSMHSSTTSDLEIDYEILLNCETAAKGWILADFPTTASEAEKLCKLGLIPTHALRIIISEEEEESDRDYKWTVIDWKKVYKFVPVMEIKMGERTIEELSHDLCKILRVMPHRHAPMLPRIVLIGSRGSGVTTQAEKLAFKYGMVHVEFEVVMARALQQNDDLAKIYNQQIETRVDPEVEAFILEKALMSESCCRKGWVLTGYPKNIDQMRMLDIIATPPNRIIFIEVPASECFVRLYYRKFDPCLGDEYKLPQIQPFGSDSFTTSGIDPEISARLLTHPKNNRKQVIHDIESYFRNKKEMMAYCGRTASFIDGNKTVDSVFELIEQIIINPAPAQPPRNPLAINHGIEESYEKLKKYRLTSGMFFNNLLLNPPEIITRL